MSEIIELQLVSTTYKQLAEVDKLLEILKQEEYSDLVQSFKKMMSFSQPQLCQSLIPKWLYSRVVVDKIARNDELEWHFDTFLRCAQKDLSTDLDSLCLDYAVRETSNIFRKFRIRMIRGNTEYGSYKSSQLRILLSPTQLLALFLDSKLYMMVFGFHGTRINGKWRVPAVYLALKANGRFGLSVSPLFRVWKGI